MGFNSLGLWIQALDSTGKLRVYVLTDITNLSTVSLAAGSAIQANQGVAGALATAWPVKPTDGTNVPVVVARNLVSTDNCIGVRLGNSSNAAIGSVTLGAGATLTANQGSAGGVAWPVSGLQTEGSIQTAGKLLQALIAKDGSNNLQFVPVVTGVSAPLTVSVIVDAAQSLYGNLPVAEQNVIRASQPISGLLKTLTPTANHLTTNATTTLTAADAWISSVVITTDAGGTTSSITVQDKSATPKKLVNAAVTTAISTTPTVLSLPQPVLMSGGIDIVTAGAVAATVDIWVSYWQ
jgi:hypothetical protein